MPLDRYYRGHGRKVMHQMKRRYGARTGEKVFYATEAKRRRKVMKRPTKS